MQLHTEVLKYVFYPIFRGKGSNILRSGGPNHQLLSHLIQKRFINSQSRPYNWKTASSNHIL